MATLLGVDLGTSSFKVSAFADTGEPLGTVARPTPWRTTPAGAELTPEAFGALVRDLVDACATTYARGRVTAVGVTGMAEVAFVATGRGDLRPARAWNVQRHPAPRLPDPALSCVTGLLDVRRTTAVELRRVTDEGTAVRAWSGLPEHAVQVLGGSAVAERSLAARSGLVDVRTGAWSPALLAWAGVDDAAVPPLVAAGRPAGEVVAGPCAGAVLTVAGHDHVVAAVGAGAADDRTVFDSLGTGEAVIARLGRGAGRLDERTVADATGAGFNVGLGVEEDDTIALAGLGTGARFHLLLAALGEVGFDEAALLDPAGRPAGDPRTWAAPLGDELGALLETLFGPAWQTLRTPGPTTSLLRRRSPDLTAARRLWWAAVVRASLSTRRSLDALAVLVPGATRLVSAGGWLGNEGIRATREQVLGPFAVPDVRQCGARGAALLAGLAAGAYRDRAELPGLTTTGAR